MDQNRISLTEFQERLEAFDWYHQFSDNNDTAQKGFQEELELKRSAKTNTDFMLLYNLEKQKHFK